MRWANSTRSECHLRLPSAVTMLREKTIRHSYIERPSLCTFSMPSHKRPCSRTILVSLYSSSTTRWRLSTFFLNSSGFLSHSSAASPFNGEALDPSQYGTLEQRRPCETYLLGSPSKLCKLRRTVWILYAAVHLSFKISKQILPEKSTLGWYIGVLKRTVGGAYG